MCYKHNDFKQIKTVYFDDYASVCSNLHQTPSETDELSPNHSADNRAGPTTSEIPDKVVRIYRLTIPLVGDFMWFLAFCVLSRGLDFRHDTGDMELVCVINITISSY